MADDEKGVIRIAEDLHLHGQIDQAKAITENENTKMADDEKGFIRNAEDLHLNEQIDQAKAITKNENTNVADDEKGFITIAENLHLNRQTDQAKAITKNENTKMADDEKGFIRKAEDLHLNGQIDQAIAALLGGLKVYPDNIVMKDLLQQYQDAKDLKTQHENKETTQNETKLEEKTNIHNIAQDIEETEQKNVNDNLQIANNSFQMRLKVLRMEINIIKTFCDKELIENGNSTFEKLCKKEACILHINIFEEVEDELLEAENLSTELMRRVNTVVNKNASKKEVKKRNDNIEVPDYRSIVTVRGTKEDVINCILKAEKALENDKLDRAESLLLKAERILPTKNARNLLQQVQAAKEQKQNSGRNTNKEEEAKAEDRKLDKNQRFDEDKINNKTSASHLSSYEAITAKTVKNDDDLALEKKIELFINLAIDARTSSEFEKARNYLKSALEKQANEDISSFVHELLRHLQLQINNQNERISLPVKEIELEANKLLGQAENCICDNDLDKAEAILFVSWDMYKNQHTTLVLKKLLKARLAPREKVSKVDENFDNISKSYNMVNLALEKYANNYDKAEKLLMEAAKLHPNNIIDKLLVEVRENKNKNNGFFAKYCNIM